MSREPAGPNYGRALRHRVRAAIEFRDTSRDHHDTTGAITAQLLFRLSNALMRPADDRPGLGEVADEFDAWMAETTRTSD